MPNGVSEGVINYAVYEDGKQRLGIATVTLPGRESEVFMVNGAGIAGEVNIPVTSYSKAMTTTINFRHANEAAYALAEERAHSITLYEVDQNYDSTSGEILTTNRKIIMRVFPISLSGGDLKPATPREVSGTYAVHYYSEIVNGKKVLEIDPINFRYLDYTGNDRAAKIRQGLGMA